MNSARSKTARTNNFICNEEKLNDELSVIKDYDRAVELIRSYPICLSKILTFNISNLCTSLLCCKK